ncbi:MAG: hypothetical protein C0596_16705 [Marinilabiliales bacterium]|nr:MAG: hypothetical protein C0596_16705 [Marinilabiliales bacterium]
MVLKLFELNESGKKILDCYQLYTGSQPIKVQRLVPAGSDRQYYRLVNKDGDSHIAVLSDNIEENKAFIYFTELFRELKFNVQEIYFVSDDSRIYFLEDLGDLSLFDIVQEDLKKGALSQKTVSLYKKAIEELVKMQISSAAYVDWSKCYQIKEFDRESILFDLNYFKYYFLKVSGVHFDEKLLQNDFNSISNILESSGNKFFMFRDFQSRNIMIKDGTPYFIDYQGGRKGGIQYDLASLLFQAKAQIPESVRDELLDYYFKQVETYIPVDDDEFRNQYYYYVLIRVLQTLGAYGFRGLIEKKSHFMESIPFALNNLRYLKHQAKIIQQFPELFKVISDLSSSDKFDKLEFSEFTVTVSSFSFKKGYPEDKTGNGGGFVFDCRGIHNPGRYVEYRTKTGRDKEVVNFFKEKTEIDKFLNNTIKTVKPTIDNYIERGFSSLNISYGCTGGQHRSVYCAENLAYYLRKQYKFQVRLIHRELGISE